MCNQKPLWIGTGGVPLYIQMKRIIKLSKRESVVNRMWCDYIMPYAMSMIVGVEQ